MSFGRERVVRGGLGRAASAVALLAAVCAAGADGVKVVRKPVLAGTWYAGSNTALAAQTDKLLAEAKAVEIPDGRPTYLIQPHAGYIYSGKAAATGLKSIRPFTFDRIIILAPTHRWGFKGASVPPLTHYATPLGEVALDTAVRDGLLACDAIDTVPEAHAREHAVEIQLPLIQWALGRHPALDAFGKGNLVTCEFRIVPVVFGDCTRKQMAAIAAALKPHVGPRTLVLVSSDFTHYGAGFGYVPFKSDIKANLAKLDGGAVEQILARNLRGFEKYLRDKRSTICGRTPIDVMLRMLPKDAKGRRLIYYTSGDVTSVWSHSVSYVSLVFCTPDRAPTTAPAPAGDLTKAEQEALLTLARRTLVEWVTHGKVVDVAKPGIALTDTLKEKRGVFVTLRKDGRLRGCIGYVVGQVPLYQGVIANAVNAASRDPRFTPVTADELAEIHIEVSALSPMAPVADPVRIEVGRHGLMITKDGRRGLLLPQVAPEQGWTREQFLEGVCHKAGLPADAWKTARLECFTAQVFAEPEK